MQTNEERDNDICHDYKSTEISELARSYGLSPKRIKQILDEKNVERRPRLTGEKRIISQVHSLIGLHLYSFREAKGLEALVAANQMGWSMIKLRRIEQGLQEIELLDLIDIATYTKTPVAQLLERKHG